jgi:lipopolysaccharide/colanic/teichoic acid biosynthesis glycosyltransferase
MIRFFDIILSCFGILIFSPIFFFLLLIGLLDTGSPLFFQLRVGKNQKAFRIIKFRTMTINTPSVATHLTDIAAITKLGRFLRQTKLDELPQFWNVLRGDMSFVGPRPCLFNQHKLIEERALRDVFRSLPGITGLAQIRGIDMSNPELLAKIDAEMVSTLNLRYYFYYIFSTFFNLKIEK